MGELSRLFFCPVLLPTLGMIRSMQIRARETGTRLGQPDMPLSQTDHHLGDRLGCLLHWAQPELCGHTNIEPSQPVLPSRRSQIDPPRQDPTVSKPAA